MKVLWFSVTPSLYCANNIAHNGGGWIEALEKLLRNEKRVELGIAFEHKDKKTIIKEGVKYYPINQYTSKSKRLLQKINYKIEENTIIPACLEIIKDFQPDLIQVFGSEWSFGLISKFINIPVIIHMQGSSPPSYNSFYPVGYSINDFLFHYKFKLKKLFNALNNDLLFSKRAEREIRILQSCNYFMGRTDWDKNIIKLYSPHAKYFYCSEVLREVFYEEKIWQFHNRDKLIITSTISTPLYKGADVILKAAKLLKDNLQIDFEWRLYGIMTNDMSFHEWKLGIKAKNVNVKICGTKSAEQIRNELLNSDIFVHPSYIDNSPNSICEAQLLGLPVVATNVGGVSSLVQHDITGLLFPANDPYTLTSYIKLLQQNSELARRLGTNARLVASKRHDPQRILKDLLQIYTDVMCENK